MELDLQIDSIFTVSSYETDTKIDIDTLWKKIYDNLQLVLSSSFSNPVKQTPIPHKDRISFSCVYCGDSTRDIRKKRGNIFSATMQYHCFNGDCKSHMSVYDFFKDKNLITNFTLEEQTYMRETGDARVINLKRLKSDLGLETFFSNELENLSVSREYIMNKLNLQEISGSRIERYLRQRLQTNFNKFGWDPKKGLLYVFNLTASLERVIGLQIKTFNKRCPYLTWKATRMHEELGIIKEENKENLEKLDFLSSIFGIFQVDLNKVITVFEGPLDSFLFPNSIALCSAKNSLPFEIEGARYFFDRDETGKKTSLKHLNNGNEVFLWENYIKDHPILIDSKIKDLNDLLIFIKRNKQYKFSPFIKYFSKNKYDAYFI